MTGLARASAAVENQDTVTGKTRIAVKSGGSVAAEHGSKTSFHVGWITYLIYFQLHRNFKWF